MKRVKHTKKQVVQPHGREKVPWLHIIIIAVLSLIIYANSLMNDFTFDDHDMIERNLLVRSLSPSNIKQIFSSSWWWGGAHQQSHEYRPLTVLSFSVIYQIGNLKPWVFHFVNIVLNAIAAVLLYYLVLRLVRNPLLALATALLFTAHPIHTEAVNNIVGQAEILSAVFFFLAFILFLDSVKNPDTTNWLKLTASYICYLAGTLSKEPAITLPAVIFVAHWFLFKHERKNINKTQSSDFRTFIAAQWKYYIGFAMVVIIYFVFRITALGGLKSTMLITFLDNVLARPLQEGDYLTYYLTALKIVGMYICLLIFPLKLSADYSYDVIALVKTPFAPGVFLTVAALAIVIVYAVRELKHNRWIPLFALLGFFIVFLPVSNFFVLIGVNMAERLMYVPSFGFCILIAWILWSLTGGKKDIFLPALAVIVLLFSARTVARNFDWKDDFTLYKKTVETNPRCTRALFNLGNHYKYRNMMQEAYESFRKAWEIAPNYGAPLSAMGEILAATNKLEEAEKFFRRVIQMEERYHPAHYNLALVLEQTGRYDEAAKEYLRTIELRPSDPAPYHELGELYIKMGKKTEGELYLKRALEINPQLYISRLRLAEFYSIEKRHEDAVRELEAAAAIQPSDPTAYFYLGKIHQALGNGKQAADNLEYALALAPQNADIMYELGAVYLRMLNNTQRAGQFFRQALEINPNHPQREAMLKVLNSTN